MNLKEQVQQDFSQYAQSALHDDLFQIRSKAFADFEQAGFPTQKDEEWKYVRLRDILQGDFSSSQPENTDSEELLRMGILNKVTSNKLVFVNGKMVPELSEWLEEDPEIGLCNLLEARNSHAEVFKKHFGKYAITSGEGLNAMNTALLNDGAFLYVPKNKSLKFPLLVTHIVDATQGSILQQPRNLIVLESNSSATVIENHLAKGNHSSFTNVVNEIFVGEGSNLEHYKVQRAAGETYQNNFTQIHQESHTNINQVSLILDGQWIRNNLHFRMNGVHSNCLLYGLYISSGNQFVDNHSRVDHAMPNCFSDEKYKGILKDQSTAVFNGKIVVHPDAQKTNAYQRNQNVLLSKEATVNTKPQLEIFADDVKCTHGATIGRLDEEPLFYMRSRGIPEKEAIRLLLNAFADDIAEKIKIPELVQILEAEIERKL